VLNLLEPHLALSRPTMQSRINEVTRSISAFEALDKIMATVPLAITAFLMAVKLNDHS
jgi:hypothetical protein